MKGLEEEGLRRKCSCVPWIRAHALSVADCAMIDPKPFKVLQLPEPQPVEATLAADKMVAIVDAPLDNQALVVVSLRIGVPPTCKSMLNFHIIYNISLHPLLS